MDIAIKTAVIGVVAVAAVLAVKKDNPAGAYILALAAIAVIVMAAIGALSPVIDFLEELAAAAHLSSEVLGTLFRVLVIAAAAHVASEACRDAGERAVGVSIELAGGAAALYVSLPLLSAVFSFLRGFAP